LPELVTEHGYEGAVAVVWERFVASTSASGPIGASSIAETKEQRDLDTRRRALRDDRRFNEDNGFYGR
jgi:hypothetical protein